MPFTATWTYGGFPIFNPPQRRAAGFANTGNQFWCPVGPAHAEAHVYMRNSDVQAMYFDGSLFRTLFIGPAGDGQYTSLSVPMCLIGATPLTSQDGFDDEAICLVRLGDRRYAAARALTCALNYNVLRPHILTTEAQNLSAFYPETLNGSSLWSAADIVLDMWSSLVSILGPAPGNISPATYELGNPINIFGAGRPAWEVMNQALLTGNIPQILSYDPWSDAFGVLNTAVFSDSIIGGSDVGGHADGPGFGSGIYPNISSRRVVTTSPQTVCPSTITVSAQRKPVRGAEFSAGTEEAWPHGFTGIRQWSFGVLSAGPTTGDVSLWSRIPEVSPRGTTSLSSGDPGFTQRHASYLSARSSARLWLALNGIFHTDLNLDWDGNGGAPSDGFAVGSVLEEFEVRCQGVAAFNPNQCRKALTIADFGDDMGLHTKIEFRRGLPTNLSIVPGQVPSTQWSLSFPWSDAGPPDYARLTHTPFHDLPQMIRICAPTGQTKYGVTVPPVNPSSTTAKFFSGRLVISTNFDTLAGSFFGGSDGTAVINDTLRDLVWVIDLNRTTHLVDGDVFNARLCGSWNRGSGTMPARPVYAVDSAEKIRVVKIEDGLKDRSPPNPSPSAIARILRHSGSQYEDPTSQDSEIYVTDPTKTGVAKDQTRHVFFNGAQSRRWEVIGGGGGKRRRFKLLTPLSQGGTAQAEIMVFQNGGYVESGEIITVSDEFLGMFEGDYGQRGLCELWDDSQKNEIYQFPCPADDGTL